MFNRPDMVSASPAAFKALKTSHGDQMKLTLIAKTLYLDWELPMFNRAQGVPVFAYRGLIIRPGVFRQCFWDTLYRGALHSCRLRLPEASLDDIALHVWQQRLELKGTGLSVDAIPWEIHAIESNDARAVAKAQFLASRG